jgi:hypothetical protein
MDTLMTNGTKDWLANYVSGRVSPFRIPPAAPSVSYSKHSLYCKDPRPHVYWGHLAALLGDGRRLGRWQMIMKESSRCASLA